MTIRFSLLVWTKLASRLLCTFVIGLPCSGATKIDVLTHLTSAHAATVCLRWLFNKQMATPAVKGVTKMGVREHMKKRVTNRKEIARVGTSCSFQHILIATFPPCSFKEQQVSLPKGYSSIENWSSLTVCSMDCWPFQEIYWSVSFCHGSSGLCDCSHLL